MKNVYIYVSDALRYDHMPDSIASEGNVIPTLSPAGYSPIAFTSMVSGKDPRNHNVRAFYDRIDVETAFDKFDNHCYYDHPDDIMTKQVFGNYVTAKELKEMEEPFFYVERALETHRPYARVGHGNEIPEEHEYDKPIEEEYKAGAEKSEEHFWRHIEELKEMGVYEDTLVIFTSDHGEWIGEEVLGKIRRDHNRPVRRELSIVPTVFLNYDNDESWERMRTIDIIPTALDIVGREPIGDGVSLLQEQPDTGYAMLQINTTPLITTGCIWKYNGEWEIKSGKWKVDFATKFIDFINPARKRLRNSKIGDWLRPDVEIDKKEKDNSETEDIDF